MAICEHSLRLLPAAASLHWMGDLRFAGKVGLEDDGNIF